MATFDEVINQTLSILRQRGRVTYRTLKRQFNLDDHALEDLKFELITGLQVAADEGGEVLTLQLSHEAAVAQQKPLAVAQREPLSAALRQAAPTSLGRSIEPTLVETGQTSGRSTGRTPRPLSQSGQVSAVRASSGASSSPDRLALSDVPPPNDSSMVGRESEFSALRGALEGALSGRGSVLLVTGEAGIGKSKLVGAARELAHGAMQVLSFRCSPYQIDTALHLFLEHVEQRLGFSQTMGPERKLQLLRKEIEKTSLQPDRALMLMTPLLSLQGPNDHVTSQAPQRQRSEALDLIASWLADDARRWPLLAVWEDMHWADATTQELMSLLVQQAEELPIVHLLTGRPEYVPSFRSEPVVAEIPLKRLSSEHIGKLIEGILGEQRLSPALLDAIVERARGVPLLVEEVVQTLLISGNLVSKDGVLEPPGDISALAIPASLHEALAVRLSHMGAAREVAQLGAVIGREFTFELLLALSQREEQDLADDLHRLLLAKIILQEAPGELYIFKHALIQDAAYQSLADERRTRLHGQLAHILQQQFPLIVMRQPELLAHHLAAAGQPAAALVFHKKAGERAISQSAYAEARAHLDRALAATAALPESQGRDRIELDLLILNGVPTTAMVGYGAPEVLTSYARARKLAEQLGEAEKIFPTLYGLWRSNLLRAKYTDGLALGEELIVMGSKIGGPSFQIAARRSVGAILFYTARFAESADHMRWLLAVPAKAEVIRKESASYEVVDSYVTAYSYLSWSSWMLGDPMRACAESDRAVELANDLQHGFSQALALSFASWLHQFRRDVATTYYRASQALAIATEKGLEMWVGWSKVLLGWAIAEQGRIPLALDTLRAGMDIWRKTGSELGTSYFLTMLAEIEGKAGQPEAGLASIAEARSFVEKTREHFWLAELSRVEGELLYLSGAGEKSVERALQRALAEALNVPLLRLRAASSAARCLGERVHPILKECLDSIDLDVRERDIVEARRLLGRSEYGKGWT